MTRDPAVRTRNPHPRLRLARVAALALVVFSIGLFGYRTALVFRGDAVTLEDVRPASDWSDAEVVLALGEAGLSVPTVYVIVHAVQSLVSVTMITVGLVIFLRKRDDWFGLYLGTVLVLVGAVANPDMTPLGRVEPALPAVLDVGGQVIWAAFYPLLTLFPDGRFVPRWTRWALAIWLVAAVLAIGQPDALPFVTLAYLLLGVGSQIYRYFRVSDTVQRQQTRWVLVAFAILALAIAYLVLSLVLYGPALEQRTGRTVMVMLQQAILVNLGLAALPVGIAVAVLRYRLWDLSVVVNRALIYGPLTTILAGLFAALVALTGELSEQVLPDSQFLPAAVSAIVVASFFQPLRTRLETWVNRRFYPERHDLSEGPAEIQPDFWPFRSPSEVVSASLSHVCQVMACHQAALYLQAGDGRFLPVGAVGIALDDLRPVALSKDERGFLERRRVAESGSPAPFLGSVPLYVEKPGRIDLVGLLTIGPRANGRGYSGDEQRGLAHLGGKIGLALHALRGRENLLSPVSV